MTLTPDQINQLAQAIAKDYQNQPDAFANRLNNKLRFDMLDIDGWPGQFDQALHTLIHWYNQPGLIGYLIRFLGEACPESQVIKQLIYQVTPKGLGGQLQNMLDDSKESSSNGLEIHISDSPDRFPNEHEAIAKRALIARQVCLINVNDLYGKKHNATGFLVGPDLVLTNYHVVKDVIQNPRQLHSTVLCKFDVGLENKQPTQIRLAEDWLIHYSEFSQAEGENGPIDDMNQPAADQLDYALIRLASPVGSQKLGNEPPRGWIRIPSIGPRFRGKMALVIPQYPGGRNYSAPQKDDAIDPEAGYFLVHNDLRVRYKVDTENGSSGSPCFDVNYNLVALHHYGGTTNKNGKSLKFNQGIPIDKIRDRLKTTIKWTQPEPPEIENPNHFETSNSATTDKENATVNNNERELLIKDLCSLTPSDLKLFMITYYSPAYKPSTAPDHYDVVTHLITWAESGRGPKLPRVRIDLDKHLKPDH